MKNTTTKEEIVITGISGRFPQSDNIDEFWSNLINGVDMVSTDTKRWPIGFLGIPERKGTIKADLTKFDAHFFGVYPKQAERVDPQIRQLFEVTYEAIVDAGVNPITIRGQNIGVYVGASAHDTFEACRKHPDIASGYDITGSSCCMLANRISYAFDFHGPSFCIDTFCSSSMMALHQGVQAIVDGQCDGAIIAGVNLLMNPMTSLQIQRVGALAPDGKCKVFDVTGNGFVRSEAIVALFIQKKSVALRSYGTIIHTKTNTDGFKINGVSYPSGKAQQRMLEDAYAESGVNPQDVFYVEPHGTGTEAGDPQEVNAITEVFTPEGISTRSTPLLIGATKSNMGHAEPAAALCAVTKTILSLKNGIIPSNLHFNTPNPNIPALLDGRIKVVTKNTPITGTLVGVNSTGLGGSNIHAIIEENKNKSLAPIPTAPVLVPISGRTEEAIQFALEKINSQPRNFEFESLMQKIAEETTPLHPYRGFTVLTKDVPTTGFDVQETPMEKPPLWFVFSGMGTLWRGMTNDLMEFDMFAKSIQKSSEILKPFGLDLFEILTNGSDDELNKNMGTCFVAMGVAIIDMLSAIGLKPDGFIGHSAGELMCGYIDGCISQRDALICYYFKDLCVTKCTGGGMASVGLTWEEAQKRCPEGIFPACHNAENNVTVSGPADSIKAFIEQLKAEGVFAREVSTGGVAYHSPYLAPILPLFDAYTSAIITNPTPRSTRWISTSIPESEWDEPQTKMGSANYVVNNMKSPVLFHGVLKYIPPNALVVEVSAHALFVGMLKKALPSTCTVMGLIRKGTGNNATQFLTAVGKMYEAGYDVKLSALYPPVEYPVPASTPAISPLIKWDHSSTFGLPDYIFNANGAGETTVEVSLANEIDAYLIGHTIDGRTLYPATGYLELVWKKFATMNGKQYEDLPIEFENVRFERATILSKEGLTKFEVAITAKTGEFSISSGDSVAVTGIVKLGTKQAQNIDMNELLNLRNKNDGKYLPLTQDDVYKELRLQGYEYSGLFKGIKMVDNEGHWANIAWNNNWVSFLDTMMQFPVVNKSTRGLFLPTRLQHVKIDPEAFRTFVENNAFVNEEGIPAGFSEKLNVIKCQGVEITGLKTSVAPRKAQNQSSPIVEETKFIPYFEDKESSFSTLNDVVKYFVDLVIENTSTHKLNIVETTDKLEDALAPKIMASIHTQPMKQANITLISDVGSGSDLEISKQIESCGVKIIPKSKVAAGGEANSVHLAIYDSEASENFLSDANFILCQTTVDLSQNAENLVNQNLGIVAQKEFAGKFFSLLKKSNSTNNASPIVLNVDSDGTKFDWFTQLQEYMIKSANDKDYPRIYITSTQLNSSGIIGLVNCLRQEPGGHKIRCVFSSKLFDFTQNGDSQISRILRNDMVMNVIDETGHIGSFRHCLLDVQSLATSPVPYAYINVETRGDLSSLKFIEAPLHLTKSNNSKMYEIYYAPLNFRDIMLATGKLPPEALPGKLASQECILGLEFVGKNAEGEAIMGMVEAKGLATHVLTDSKFVWKIPKKWTMEDAATVPVAYSTAYYALIVRGRMRPRESILIHSGSGGVGQAAIAIALSMNCTVYTTVGSDEKKAFLMKQFPQLKLEHFANSRDTKFEQHIMTHTEGKGVDLVLNSLAEEKLQASVRCLSEGGRFLEIGKFDLSRNNSLGMAIFLKNVTFHGILLDALFDKYPEDQYEVIQLVNQGIESGTVRPLPRVVFQNNEIEEAFRFMANGKHMGKVLLKIKDDSTSNLPRNVAAKTKTYFNPSHSYIIVGGLGGFGMELASWMVQRNAKKLILVSRSKIKNGYQQLAVRRWASSGVEVMIAQHDVATVEGITQLFEDSAKIGPIGGVFNLAMVLKDGFIENQNLENFETVCRPKVPATIHLDKVSQKLCPDLEYFVVFSSAASGKGNIGQTNYGYANSTMERICENRRKLGLPGLAIQWGAIGDVGVILDSFGGNDIVLGGTVPQRLSSCLQLLDVLLRNSQTNSRLSPIIASAVLPEQTSNNANSSNEKPSLLVSVGKILGLKASNYPSSAITLGELGIDSLMAVELKQLLENYSDLTLSTNAIRELSWGNLEKLDNGESI